MTPTTCPRCHHTSQPHELHSVRVCAACVRRLEADRDHLRGIVQALAARVAAQSELLSRRAEKEPGQ